MSNGGTYFIYSGDSTNVINAQACGMYASLITYPAPGGCSSGSNEVWQPVQLSNGYDIIRADYNGYYECMLEGYQNYFSATPCPPDNFPSSEQFRQPQNTPAPCASGWYYVVPATDYNLTLNVKGGLGARHDIIGYSQSGCPNNDIWYFYGV